MKKIEGYARGIDGMGWCRSKEKWVGKDVWCRERQVVGKKMGKLGIRGW